MPGDVLMYPNSRVVNVDTVSNVLVCPRPSRVYALTVTFLSLVPGFRSDTTYLVSEIMLVLPHLPLLSW